MKIPDINEMALPGEARYLALLELQEELNKTLRDHF
jgi:hypothetical protein